MLRLVSVLGLVLALSIPASGQATVFGTACNSPGNPAPAISFSGSTTPGSYGITSITGAPPGALCVTIVGTDNETFGAEALPKDLTGFFGVVQPGCWLWVDTNVVLLYINADPSGEIHFEWPVPDAIGEYLYFQWAVVENPTSIVLTEGLEVHMTAVPTVSSPSLAFESVSVGDASAPQQITLTNDTDLPITVTDVITVGSAGVDFQAVLDDPTPVVLNPGQDTTATLTFAPQSAGLRAATVEIVQQTLPAFFAPASVAVSGTAIGPPGAEQLVNAGGSDYFSTQGEVWSADFGGTGGGPDAAVGNPDILGTDEDALYWFFRSGQTFSYALPVPSAEYDVTLHFAETRFDVPGNRIFDVTLEGGAASLVGVDPYTLAGGKYIAHTETLTLMVTDGTLDIDVTAQGGSAAASLSAIEVRSRFAELTLDLTGPMDFGFLPAGNSLVLPLQLENTGTLPLTVDDIDFLIGPTGGAGHEFLVDFMNGDGPYSGDHDDVNLALTTPVVIAPGATAQVDVTFAPTEHVGNEIILQFNGSAFASRQITLLGAGGFADDPFLHPVLEIDPVAVDYDEDGFEDIFLDGDDSHTHEPGRALVGWEWTEGPTVVASTENATVSFPLGSHTVCLEIFDDNAPQHSLSDCADFDIYPPDAIPGVLALYYYAGQASPDPFLDNIPANADFAEVRADMSVQDQGAIGGSPYSESVMVRLQGSVDIDTAGDYVFVSSGGDGQRLEINGSPVDPAGEIVTLGVGAHAIEARFVVNDLQEMPLEVTYGPDAGNQSAISGADLTHDARLDAPVINTMPTTGITLGGNKITIEGFGFFTDADVVVHWGGTDLTQIDFTKLEADVIEFFSPPHAGGIIQVTVEAAGGVSNALNFTYDAAATPPINFTKTTPIVVDNPTVGEWGPDGRLYVFKRNGELKAYTFDETWTLLAVDTYAGVNGLSNNEPLGIAFNPYDPPSPVRVYVGHAELFANGGGPFAGTSDYSGAVSVLEGPDFIHGPSSTIISGLPVSNHDHAVNGMQFDNNGDLLIAVGGNTNAGIPSNKMGTLPESPLSAAILKAELSDPAFNGVITYEETVGGAPNMDQVFGDIVDVVPGTHVSIHATGLRNAFDIAFTTWGGLYATDNGPNSTFGPRSLDCATDGTEVGSADELDLIEYGNYYGHPNRNRGRYDARQCVYRTTSEPSVPHEFTQKIASLSSSSDGIMEYRATTFLGQMYGDLIVEKWNNPVKRFVLSSDHRTVTNIVQLEPNLSSLDICQGPGGVIIGIDYTTDIVSLLIPLDVSALGVTAFDIHPWRAPATGGVPFIIGGKNFDTIATTSVTIGGIPAALTNVTSERIEGIIPANLSPTTDMLDVVVTSGGNPEQSIIPGGFRYLYVPAGNEPGRWDTNAPPLPVALGEVAAGEIDGVLYVVGEGSNKTLAYDIQAKTWDDTLAVRPFAGHHHGAEVLDGKLYIIGGLPNVAGGAGAVQIYDPVLDSWSTGASMPWNGGSVSTALIDGKIYTVGGIVGSTTVSNCAVYDPVLDTWTSLTSVNPGRNHTAAGTDGEKLYIFGGRGFGSGGCNCLADGYDNVQIFDPDDGPLGSWTTSYDLNPPGSDLAPLPVQRGGMGKAIWYQDEFYVFGGETQNNPGGYADPTDRVYDRVDVYNPATNTWRLEAEMPAPRHGIFPVLYQSRIFVAGGGWKAGFSQSSVLDIYTRQ